MSNPPPGYDDEHVVPQKQLQQLLGQFEYDLQKVEQVFHQNVLLTAPIPPTELEREFVQLRDSAESLGADYPFLIERLIADYENFRDEPSEQKLHHLFGDVRTLQLMLVG